MKPQNTRELLEDIANLLLEHEQEQREEILFEELNRATIYRASCWDIINEARPVSFYCPLLGEANTTPEALAWSILYNQFLNDYSTLID